MKGATACIIGFLTWSQVSIHAPMKGATHRGRNPGIGLGVSIHAPMKGATTKVLDRWIFYTVSIHAPMKGATSFILS